MQFLASRQLSFGITVSGQRMVVMFGEPNGNGICAFYAKTDVIANAVMRHPYYKQGVIWAEGEAAPNTAGADGSEAAKLSRTGQEQAQGQSEAAELPRTEPEQNTAGVEHSATSRTVETGANAQGGGMNSQEDEAGNDEDDKEQTFGNFTEAKEWFCKTYGVLRTAVRNPTALQREAEKKGVVIRIGG